MKKKILVFAVLTISATCVFAQVADSTSVGAASGGIASLIQLAITFCEKQITWLTGIVGVVVAIDHALAANKNIAANSTYQWISNLLSGVK